MNNDPKTQNMEATPTMLRTREEGTPEDRWQQEEVLGFEYFWHRPGSRRRCQRSARQNVRRAVPFSLQPKGSPELTSHPEQLFESHMVGSQLGFLSEVDPGQGF